MKTEQKGMCAWCLKPLGLKFAVDHNHLTGLARALMHISCNTEAGFVERWLTSSDAERKRRLVLFR